MKKRVFVASYILLAGLALSPVASAQSNPAQSLSKLIQIVRNSNSQYQDVVAPPPLRDTPLSWAASAARTTQRYGHSLR